ncbi:hypothetical protein FGIG_01908 [Fasciola gigantica]|uniref:Uncharacterized protein n=1 Tax=Fasciola gigantica TaxID=46835 RepID=A0A504YBT6_FASGI|nr:hypothetical protein FGIG_01908 [Fasciola gigantica]
MATTSIIYLLDRLISYYSSWLDLKGAGACKMLSVVYPSKDLQGTQAVEARGNSECPNWISSKWPCFVTYSSRLFRYNLQYIEAEEVRWNAGTETFFSAEPVPGSGERTAASWETVSQQWYIASWADTDNSAQSASGYNHRSSS